ncbi:ROK family protein [Mucilaginibacter myungsuensis]|uniref:ROK family protein n=1 Tax=Mucilaginibacter myungsuensis TaxID=649104 RepID=A0A929PX14_9SPHI|nr:ROK family protein [Mucilaginibacter myungsuensis]MBE9661910.1 ROK family protein [Mucilaginibacter myungsuensis]MDN3599656.1 ROK family protein [Mucilaginibacter myungsuensis]
MKKQTGEVSILSIDIGGSNVKATILNKQGQLTMEYDKIETPMPSTPKNMMEAIKKLVKKFPNFDNISVGFPGFVKNGVVMTAPNLGNKAWEKFDLQDALSKEFGKPARVVNDADMAGLGVVNGKGLEMVITLGTGFGTALLQDGVLLPHLEISHHPIAKGQGYDDYIGDRALDDIGEKKWNKRMKKVFEVLKTVFNYDSLYIGGGNARKLTFKLDSNMKLVTNEEGIKGGARLWNGDHIQGINAVIDSDKKVVKK